MTWLNEAHAFTRGVPAASKSAPAPAAKPKSDAPANIRFVAAIQSRLRDGMSVPSAYADVQCTDAALFKTGFVAIEHLAAVFALTNS